jgi:hypothetical protein
MPEPGVSAEALNNWTAGPPRVDSPQAFRTRCPQGASIRHSAKRCGATAASRAGTPFGRTPAPVARHQKAYVTSEEHA